MIWYVVTLVVALAVVTLLILWRVLPVLKGTARPGDSIDERFFKWNTNMRPLLRRHLEIELLVALASVFKDKDGQEHSLSVWSLEPTIMPDVDFIALSEPVDEASDSKPKIRGMIDAESLRDFLDDKVASQTMFGHMAWVYVWPDDVDFDAISQKLTPPDVFRKVHGLSEPKDEKESP